jgi:hypothetical protein
VSSIFLSVQVTPVQVSWHFVGLESSAASVDGEGIQQTTQAVRVLQHPNSDSCGHEMRRVGRGCARTHNQATWSVIFVTIGVEQTSVPSGAALEFVGGLLQAAAGIVQEM